jgi:hypothetical protein
MKLDLKKLDSATLVDGLKVRVQTERKITSEIIEFIQEIDRRRVYLEYGVTSLFSFLTDVIGYSRSAAQRRIEAARLSNEVPEIHESFKSGELNLSHVSLLAQAIKQKEKETSSKVSGAQKQQILEKLKSQPIDKSEVILAKELNLKLKSHDVYHPQKDESLRAEMTFSKNEMVEIERAKSLLSHQIANPKLSELFLFLVRDLLKRKDPLKKKITPASGHTMRQYGRTYTPVSFDKALHERDQSCRWKDPKTGKVCCSTFQLQKDHIVPLWQEARMT